MRTLAACALLTLCPAQSSTTEPFGAKAHSPASLRGVSTRSAIRQTSDRMTGASDMSQVHLVKVGAGGFKFEPDVLHNISIGDIVAFEFYPPDHSVARADFGSACVPYESTGKDRTGFWSGTQLVQTVGDVSDSIDEKREAILTSPARSLTGI
jgi:hypothetical protein